MCSFSAHILLSQELFFLFKNFPMPFFLGPSLKSFDIMVRLFEDLCNRKENGRRFFKGKKKEVSELTSRLEIVNFSLVL